MVSHVSVGFPEALLQSFVLTLRMDLVIKATLLHVLTSLNIVILGSIRIVIWTELQKHEIFVLKDSCPVLTLHADVLAVFRCVTLWVFS